MFFPFLFLSDEVVGGGGGRGGGRVTASCNVSVFILPADKHGSRPVEIREVGSETTTGGGGGEEEEEERTSGLCSSSPVVRDGAEAPVTALAPVWPPVPQEGPRLAKKALTPFH